jgi:ribosomal protein S18 acetylase RimI-like enzyme
MTIRSKTDADAPAIAAIAAALPEWFTETGRRHIAIDSRFQDGFVAVDDTGALAAFITYFVNQGVGHVGWLGVAPALHRRGAGRALLAELEAALRSAGVAELEVSTLGDSVLYEPYARTRAFYRAMGFADYRRELLDNPECPEMLWLRKTLAGGRPGP